MIAYIEDARTHSEHVSVFKLALDQAYEQNNDCVKGDGGAIGLTQNPAALRRWMVSGPAMASFIEEFQTSTSKPGEYDGRLHDETKNTQATFFNQVTTLTSVIDLLGNPFTDDSNDLLVLDPRDLVDSAVITTMPNIGNLGQEQYSLYRL